MTRDEWRIRIDLPDEAGAGFLERLGLLTPASEELAEELREQRLAATRDGDTVFVYAESAPLAERARAAVAAQLAEDGLEASDVHVERWLEDERRWEGDAPGPTVEEDMLARGWAPWEVRVECSSHGEARDLARRLEDEGYSVVRTWRYVFAGTSSRAEAEELAARVHGTAEPGGEMVWEVLPRNPFVVFGGLGGTGTPL